MNQVSASVSVIVPVLNGARTIGDTLRCLVQQSEKPADLEIIAVDNGSTDNTVEIVGRFQVTLLREEKQSPGAARNRGLRAARGEIIVHLDADTLPTRNWLSELLKPFSEPAVMLAGGRTLAFLPKTPAERYVAASGLYDPENHIRREIFPFVPSLNLAVLREVAMAVNGWSEELRTAEDVDFCHRLLRKFPERRMVYQPSAVLFHRNRQTDDEMKEQARTYGQGAAEIYRRYPDVTRWDLAKSIHLVRIMAARLLAPLFLRARFASAEEVEFAKYRKFWTYWFWRGFFSVYFTSGTSHGNDARIGSRSRL